MRKIHALILAAAVASPALAAPLDGPYFGYSLGQVVTPLSLLQRGAHRTHPNVYELAGPMGTVALTLNTAGQVIAIEGLSVTTKQDCARLLKESAAHVQEQGKVPVALAGDHWETAKDGRSARGQCVAGGQQYAFDVSFVWDQRGSGT